MDIIVSRSLLFAIYSIVVASSWISIPTKINNNQKKKSLPLYYYHDYYNPFKSKSITTSSTSSLFLEKQSLGNFEPLTTEELISYNNTTKTKRKVRVLDYISQKKQKENNANYMSFDDGYNIQLDLLNQQLKRIEYNRNIDNDNHQKIEQWYDNVNDKVDDNYGYDCIMFLEHKPVYTLGRASDPSFILNNNNNNNISEDDEVEICKTDRGGEVTYHGPGQIVVYPILDLRGYRKDVHWYIRALEEVILQTLYSLNVTKPTRSDDFTGIYVFDNDNNNDNGISSNKSKIASIGVKLRRWVTMHGLSVNIDAESLNNFKYIIPCGLIGFNVTCVNYLLKEADQEQISIEEFKECLIPAFEDVFKIKLVE